jgi:hypothetical protein
MKKIKLKNYFPKGASHLKSKFLTSKDYDTLITEDCDGYDMYGNLLFKFRKNSIPIEILKSGYEAFKGSIKLTDGRGAASGSSHKRVRKDGSISKITIGNKVSSGNVGYMDAGAMIHYCRQTAFAKKHFDKFKSGIPFVEFVDKKYQELCPSFYEKQIAIAKGTNSNYRIAETSFTTVTVNKNFQTAVHQDSGDFKDGFGNLIVYREGEFKGSYFCMPEYRIAIDLQNTDILFADVHAWHGNTNYFDCSEDYMRVSFVMYYRENMYKCKQPAEQLKEIKINKTGFLNL